jgi:hypothetical protein
MGMEIGRVETDEKDTPLPVALVQEASIVRALLNTVNDKSYCKYIFNVCFYVK